MITFDDIEIVRVMQSGGTNRDGGGSEAGKWSVFVGDIMLRMSTERLYEDVIHDSVARFRG
jgi:hypothetical protein